MPRGNLISGGRSRFRETGPRCFPLEDSLHQFLSLLHPQLPHRLGNRAKGVREVQPRHIAAGYFQQRKTMDPVDTHTVRLGRPIGKSRLGKSCMESLLEL